MALKKAVIPVAGFGTRMLPAAKAVPKEMLPILDKPTVQYVVEEAAAAGIDDVLLVTSRDKRAIEDHFDRSPELEARLRDGRKDSLLASINDLMTKVKIHAVRQPSPRGLGDAVNQAREHVGGDPFVCMLGDAIFSGGTPPAVQLAAAYERLGTAIVGVEMVPPEKVSRYGIIGGSEVSAGVFKIERLVEKPPLAEAPSRLAIAARYVLTPRIFECLDQTKAGHGGEIHLTDALQLLLQREPIHAVILDARRHDIGNPIDWLKTNILYASRNADVWREISKFLDDLMQ